MNAQHIAWDDLEVFLSVVRHGSLSAAARELGVNHATLSRRVARLEEELRVRLFDRRRRGMLLTAAGEELQAHVERIETEVLAIGRKVAGRDQRVEGVVRVSTVDDIAFVVLPGLVAAFREEYPGVRVEVEVTARIRDMSRREADLGLRMGSPPQDAGSLRRRVVDVDSRMYASVDYLARHTLPAGLEDLGEHPLVLGDEGMSGVIIERAVLAHADPAKLAFRSGSMLARVAALRAGVGIGMLSDYVAAEFPDLRPIRMTLPDLRAAMWLVVHPDVRRSARVRAFADFAVDYIRARKDRFAAS